MLDAMHLSREQSAPAATATFEHTAAALRVSCDGATCAALCRRLNGVIDAKKVGDTWVTYGWEKEGR